MIEWLVQSASAHPDLARGCPPAGLLGASELGRFQALRTEKRRHDWLLGRWTAKHLVQSYITQLGGVRVPLDAIEVASDPDGAPRLGFRDWELEIGTAKRASQFLISNPQSLSLSISHSRDRAFCAISAGAAACVGADIEKVEPRDPGFVADYFTPTELEQLRAARHSERDIIATAIWSAKEAALKALRLGLTVDTRALSCTLSPPERLQTGWAPFAVSCEPALLGCDVRRLSGWWQLVEGYALTIAILRVDGP
jgi:4'-phosphopantetheinyl transferase